MLLLEFSNKRFYKLLYIVDFSFRTKKKLKNNILKYCTSNTNNELVFSSFKITLLFLMKDMKLFGLKAYVIYEFVCGSCKSDCNCRTKQHL